MPYQPTYPFPYNRSIDGNSIMGNVFRCRIDDYDKVVRATLFIYEITTNREVCRIDRKKEGAEDTKTLIVNGVSSTLELDIAEDSLLPIVGGKGDASFLQIVVPQKDPTTTNNILINGYEYKWKIRLYGEKDNVWIAEGNFVEDVTFPNKVYISDNSRILEGQNINIGDNKYEIVDLKKLEVSGEVTSHIVESTQITCSAPSGGGTLEDLIKNFDGEKDYTELYLVLTNLDTFTITDITGNVITVNEQPTVSYLNKRYTLVRYCNIAKTLTGTGTQEKNVYYHLTSNFIESMEYYFMAQEEHTPIIKYLEEGVETNVPSTINSSVGEFVASFDGDLLYYKWTLQKKEEGKYTVIEATEEIFSSYIQFKYEGFTTGDDYRLILEVVTKEKSTSTVSTSFNVLYDKLLLPIEPVAFVDCEKKAIKVDFSNFIEIRGITDETKIDYLTYGGGPNSFNTCLIHRDNKISWERITGQGPLSIKPTYSIAIRFKPQPAYVGQIFEMIAPSGAVYSCVLKDTQTIGYTIANNSEITQNIEENFSENWWILFVFSDGITLLKEDGTEFNMRESSLSNIENEYSDLKISGEIEYNYVWTLNKLLTDEEKVALNNKGGHNPVWDLNTYFLANFEGNSNASPLYVETGSVTGAIAYRQNITEGTMLKIAELRSGENYFYDYAVSKNNTYKYLITPIYKKNITNTEKFYLGDALETNTVNYKLTTFSIIGTLSNFNEKEDYIYKVDPKNIWHLDLNVNTSGVNVVTDKTVFDGLYKYAKVNSTNKNYKTGNVKTLLGRISKETDYQYKDSIKLANKWQEFCNNGLVKLLRDQQGNLIPVDITAKSFEYNNRSMPTTISISFDWVQIGSEEKISVYETGMSSIEDSDAHKKLVIFETLSDGSVRGKYLQDKEGIFLTSEDLVEY